MCPLLFLDVRGVLGVFGGGGDVIIAIIVIIIDGDDCTTCVPRVVSTQTSRRRMQRDLVENPIAYDMTEPIVSIGWMHEAAATSKLR